MVSQCFAIFRNIAKQGLARGTLLIWACLAMTLAATGSDSSDQPVDADHDFPNLIPGQIIMACQ